MKDIFSYSMGGVALVNPVNCAGVMGAGLALQFKEHYPIYSREYEYLCARHLLRPGTPIIHQPRPPSQPSHIVSFPTKDHWKYQSKIDWIGDGLMYLSRLLSEYPDIFTIVVPPLGCGLGGLDYHTQVRPLIVKYLWDLDTELILTSG